jgi:FkbM family methyltransferase
MRNLHLKEELDLFYPERLFQSICDEDKLVLDFFENKHNGYAIDIGAADGVCINNCFKLFNTPYEWNGLSIEANPRFYKQLDYIFENTGVSVYKGAIHPEHNEVEFYQMIEEGSRIGHSNTTGQDLYMPHNTINVPAKSINNILNDFNVPNYIDFISMDIEGAEKYVLDYWDYDKYKVKMWCIEKGHRYEEFFNTKGYVSYIPQGYELCHGNYFFINNNI